MNFSPGSGVNTSIGLGVGYKESVDLSADSAAENACLVIGDHVAEIRLERSHLETLRDQLPGVLADLTVLEAADKRAATAGNRVLRVAADLTDRATSAEQAGEHERARELRGTVDKLMAALTALENALAAVETAAQAADDVADDATGLLKDRGAEEQAAPGQPPEMPPSDAA